MADLGTNVRYIKGIGEARAAALEKLGITTLGDLIAYFPRGYEDRTAVRPIRELTAGECVCVRGMVAADLTAYRISGGRTIAKTRVVDDSGSLDLIAYFPRGYEDRTAVRPIRELTAGECVCVRGMVAADLTAYRISGGRTIAKTRVVDDSGSLDLVFFNMEHRRDALHQGDVCVFFGKVEDDLRRKQMINPLFEPEGRQQVTGRIMPIYPLTAGVTQGLMARAARQGLDACRELLPDVLPDEVRQAHSLCYVNYAYENIHFPSSPEALEVARRRLVFEELFLLTCGLQLLRQRRRDVAGPACRRMSMEPFYRRLPFALTGAQRRAIADAVGDMVSGKPMNRLCQGDVGSGKTMVAAACIWFAVENGWQTALMAPTEILARQHYQGLAPLLARFSIRCALLTGSIRAKERREILAGLADGSIDLCIGTHALLTEDVQYRRLGLVVTDEQHRFGVNQRAALSQKAEDPHMLVLSATPIPRTLALVIYGDLDVSVIDELPPGRQKVDTFALGESYRPRVQAFIRKLAAAGQQIFIVCPLVGEADQIPDERKAVTAYAKQLQEQVFPDLRVAVLHGKMKPREKEKVMAAFAAGESDILVSTTVVEVGVDVPNATCMVVENADRFGLSQLHQLRGRVGRGKAKSYCILLSDSQNEETRARLKVMTQTNDGFRISQEDLRLRGPGDFFGQRQHGLPAMKIADLSCDMRLLDEAQTAARQLMERDPELTDPAHRPLRRRIRQLFDTNADMLN